MEQTKQKVFTYLPFVAEVFLLVAVLSFLASYLGVCAWDSRQYLMLAVLGGLMYLVSAFTLFVGAVMMTVLNVKQKKGCLILSEIKHLNIGPERTYILADNWYISFLWICFITMVLPLAMFLCNEVIALIAARYLMWLTIAWGLIVNARATYLSIEQKRKAES